MVELPTYENDLLHALTATGGLPGVDAQNEVWIFRNGSSENADLIRLVSETSDVGEEFPETVIEDATRIPLRIEPGAPVEVFRRRTSSCMTATSFTLDLEMRSSFIQAGS